MKIILLSLLLLGSQPVSSATDSCVVHFEKLGVHSNLERLKQNLLRKHETLARLKTQKPKIKKVLAEISKSGIMNRGVYRVLTDDGQTLALKISLPPKVSRWSIPGPEIGAHQRLESEISASYVIQNELARYGVAPEIKGIYSVAALREMVPELRKVNPYVRSKSFIPDHAVGVLMEEIPGAWNISKEGRQAPAYLKVRGARWWNKKIGEAKEIQRSLQLHIVDEQLATANDGRVMFLDLDFAIFANRPLVLDANSDAYPYIVNIENSVESYTSGVSDALKELRRQPAGQTRGN